MSTTQKKPPSGGVGRVSTSESNTSPTSSPSRGHRPSNSTSTPSTASGHTRTRSVRTGTPVSARAALARRDTTSLTHAESEARAETASAVEDLQQRLEREEKLSEQYKKQNDVLQSKLEDAIKESSKLEEKVHEHDELIETLRNEKREATRQIREMESIYESEKSSILKEKEEMSNREEEMQAVIQRLKDSLAQRINGDDDGRPSRQANVSPSLDGNSFAPPSSLQRSDSRNSSKFILQKDKLIESLRLELAEAQIKLIESENQGGGRLQEVERLLMEARMANARLMEDNESYQLLLQEKTLKGDFGQNDFSYMNSNSNQDALNALEGKTGGSSLADELSEAAEADGEGDRRLESELKSMKEQNKALTLYINKIIERLLQHQDFESILDIDSTKGPTSPSVHKDLPPTPGQQPNGPSLLQRAKTMAVGQAKPRQRPMSVMPMPSPLHDHTNPDTAPSIPISNLTRSASTRRSRPQSEQYTGAASLVSQMYKGPEGPASPTLGNTRHSQSFFSPAAVTSNPNAAARNPSGHVQTPSSGNFPGMRSETSSISGDSGGLSTPPSQNSPPRSHSDKGTTFAGGKPRPLRLVQENTDALKENKRASWIPTSWSWGKKDETAQSGNAIPE